MSNILSGSHWVIFAAIGVAASYAMRLLAWAGAKQGAARVAEARQTLGLPAKASPGRARERSKRR